MPSFICLGLANLLNSFLEILGIGLLLPLVAFLGKPELVHSNPIVARVYDGFHFQSFPQFIIVIASGVIAVFVAKALLLTVISFWQAKFVLEKKTFLKARLFRGYLMSPYTFHLKSDLARMQRNLELVDSVMSNSVLQLFYIFTELVLVLCLFLVLLVTYPLLTLLAAGSLGGAFGVFVACTKGRLRTWGEIAGRHKVRMLQQVNQGLGSIKEVKIFGKEDFFAGHYRHHVAQYSWQETKAELVSKAPRLFIEVLVVGLVMLGVIYCMWTGKASEKIFVTISLFVVVAVRLMPSMNRISAGWASIRNSSAYFDQIYGDLVASAGVIDERLAVDRILLPFQRELRLEAIDFSYEGAECRALDGVSLTVPKNATVGFVGPSGAGKTTVIDIIIGVLKPAQGRVLVDGVDVQGRIRAWQDQIGYIPQAIYLCNESIRQNVAFGIEPEKIDDTKVWRALELAQLDVFVKGLPSGLLTEIGERGVRLSGGQRQRIGIARALYNDPAVLVMDEATAALDNETERDFMDSLTSLSGSKTILIIAHRLTTVQACDVIFFMKDGKLVSSGRYDQLTAQCQEFRDMAGAGITA